MDGRHLIKSWSRQQRVIAVSFVEEGTYGMVACPSEFLGIQSCAAYLGMELSAAVYADATARLASCRDEELARCATFALSVPGVKKPTRPRVSLSRRLAVVEIRMTYFTDILASY